jgi:hypothetical protein
VPPAAAAGRALAGKVNLGTDHVVTAGNTPAGRQWSFRCGLRYCFACARRSLPPTRHT